MMPTENDLQVCLAICVIQMDLDQLIAVKPIFENHRLGFLIDAEIEEKRAVAVHQRSR
jgi:hypothetical protein